jgi:hypothetical protein
MQNLFYFLLFFTGSVFSQSIQLNQELVKTPAAKRPVSYGMSYVEFRDAELSNIWMLIETQSGLKISSKKLPQTQLSLRLENVSWTELLKIVRNQATP